jgi:hypothetical protein
MKSGPTIAPRAATGALERSEEAGRNRRFPDTRVGSRHDDTLPELHASIPCIA